MTRSSSPRDSWAWRNEVSAREASRTERCNEPRPASPRDAALSAACRLSTSCSPVTGPAARWPPGIWPLALAEKTPDSTPLPEETMPEEEMPEELVGRGCVPETLPELMLDPLGTG